MLTILMPKAILSIFPEFSFVLEGTAVCYNSKMRYTHGRLYLIFANVKKYTTKMYRKSLQIKAENAATTT